MMDNMDIQDASSVFDVKGFLFKLVSYWPLFIISFAIAFGVAYYINVRKLPIYQMSNMISIKDDQNPFFTTNTSLTFNWGGTSDKVNTAVIALKSRSHNEKVVDLLQFYVKYALDGEYRRENAYKRAPFIVKADTTVPQLLGQEIKIVFTDSTHFELSAEIAGGNKAFQTYDADKTIERLPIEPKSFAKVYELGQTIRLPFFTGTLNVLKNRKVATGVPYYLSFQKFDTSVKRFLQINVSPQQKGSSVLVLSLNGTNKHELVDYLNASVAVLSRDVLDRKNLFATKTIRFIDSTLQVKTGELADVEAELNDFRNQNAIYDLTAEGQKISERLNALDLNRNGVLEQLEYLKTLESYLISHTDYNNVPAPSVAGIAEMSIVNGVNQIMQKAQERSTLEYSYKEGSLIFQDIDRQIDAIKTVLLENIRSSKSLKDSEIQRIDGQIAGYEAQIRRLPREQQELLEIQRRYNLSQTAYNLFLSKRSEAGLVKAANVSDVLVIDPAKDTGGGKIGPNTRLNYVMAALFGGLVPFLVVLLIVLVDTRIHSVKDIQRQTNIPIIGTIGKSRMENNLAVINKPKSVIAESFRAIRSSLQFIYRQRGISGAKTVLVTSSISGEGKTFCSINVASVFALSGKKTVLVGLDLRKPKIFGDFDIDNKIGVVNYLIGDSDVDGIIQNTMLDSLDVITSGPVPPNPAELLMSEKMDQMITHLKDQYDYIILDSPPVGLVSDSLELLNYADATIYMVRQNYTKKGMFRMINEKHKRGEIGHISLVFNFFETKAKYGYGYGNDYGYGYGYGYGQGYHDEERPRSLWNRLFRRKRKK